MVAPGAFWGRSLYFYAVAFVGFVISLGGVVGVLFSLIDAALVPSCPTFGPLLCADAGDAVRAAANGAIVTLVAGTVWWWHLREGRRTVTP